jgi:hypothetical protein
MSISPPAAELREAPATPRHAYFVSLDPDNPIPWNPFDPEDLPLPDCIYFGGVFRAFEQHWEGPPLTIYITKGLQRLPTYGDDVIALVVEDEWYRVPAWSGEVRAVVRNLNGRTWFPWKTLLPPDTTSLVALLNLARVLTERERYQRKSRKLAKANGWRPMTRKNLLYVPVGYFKQPEKPIKPFEQRTTDMYFGGSLLHDLDRRERWKRWFKKAFGNPKQLYREQMIRHVEALAAKRPGLEVKTTVSGDHRALGEDQIETYADDMMNSKFGLVPRGTHPESYRFFEALRYGCIPVIEDMPQRRFYRQGAPIVRVEDWRKADEVLGPLLDSPEQMREMHEAVLRWWREECSEEATGRILAADLAALPPLPDANAR